MKTEVIAVDIPIGVIDLRVLSQECLLSRLIRPEPPDLIAVLFGL